MLPRHLFHSETPAGSGPVVPSYVCTRDTPWLRALLDEHARFAGRKQKELAERLREPLPARAPKAKLELARRVLESIDRQRPKTPIAGKLLRLRVFLAASASKAPRRTILEQVSAELGVTLDDIERSLFADLRGERRVGELPSYLTPEWLALESNRTLVVALLRRAASVRVRARGNTRQLVRHVHRLGLICRLELDQGGRVALTVSGPFALFRHTEVYGRALASLVPRAALCDQFELEVTCSFGKGEALSTVLVRSGDPIAGPEQLEVEESAEERFARDFSRIAKDWYVLPNPPSTLQTEGAFVPRCEIVHRTRPEERFVVELGGYWTRESVTARVTQMRAAAGERFVVCVDERRQCGRDDVTDPRVLRYVRRLDPRAVLARLESESRTGD